jgi:uncharacterized RDD family membrane protein YckC
MSESLPPPSYDAVIARAGGSGPGQSGPCPTCGRAFGSKNICQVCGQLRDAPAGVRASSVARRLGAFALDYLLLLVTLIIGWLIWSAIVWKDGQTPAKQLLHMRTVRLQTGERATWGTMCLRELVGKWLLVFTLIGGVTGGIGSIVLSFMLCWDANRQELWDKIAGTIVVDDRA